MICAWCKLGKLDLDRQAITVYRGDALCEYHLREKREQVREEWLSTRRSQKPPW